MGGVGWSFSVDRGGTFTDIIGEGSDGRRIVKKLLSENPEAYDDAAAEGVRRILNEAGPGALVRQVRIGTTVATNALLERKGAPTVLAITKGLADVLRIGHQARPRLFDLDIRRPAPLYAAQVEIDERLDVEGRVLRALDLDAAERQFTQLRQQGFDAIAIVLMHSWRFPAHELALQRLAIRLGFGQVSVSHEVNPLVRIAPRGDTTVADAYLSPVTRAYVGQVQTAMKADAPLYFMQSNGGLTDALGFRGKDAVLSGPAGGVVGMVAVARAAGFDKVIGFDMGGTSTDVSHYAGAFERSEETEISGVRLRTPMLSVHTIAAGGGSICRFDGLRLRVGPDSAGASPGPAAYRRGGPLTLTDCNLVLGKLQPDLFPAVFGPSSDQALDADAARARLEEIADQVRMATGEVRSCEALAEGFLAIAVESMARAIRAISQARGHDLADYCLVAFGGAGGQHASLVAETLGVASVLIHPLAGVLSAHGIALAEVSAYREKALEVALTEASVLAAQTLARELGDQAHQEIAPHAVSQGVSRVTAEVAVRRQGSDTALTLDLLPEAELRAAFAAAHQQRFGFSEPDADLILQSLRVTARLSPTPVGRADSDLAAAPPIPFAVREVHLHGERRPTAIFRRDALLPGQSIEGPALILEATGANTVDLGWRAQVTANGDLVLRQTRAGPSSLKPVRDGGRDPIRLELYNNRFMAIAEEMGQALQNTAHSVNIKERLDFSCALFDAGGALVANAPHMPVHLGSMGESVRAVVAASQTAGRPLAPGQVYLLNAPYCGGAHLPDITVVQPVFFGGDRPRAFVAARGHHSDIGGVTPGSMPPMSRTLEEEGVIFEPRLLVNAGRFLEAEIRAALTSGPYPARSPDQNIADLKAQVASCRAGVASLEQLIATCGETEVFAYMGHVQANAADAVRAVIGRMRPGEFSVLMDEGAIIAVSVRPDPLAGTLEVDFTGTSPQRATNYNAPLSVCRAATLYVLRTLIDDDIPLNDGCMMPVRLIVPAGAMLNPSPEAAVVAGNVETSQAICDALFGAFGVLAASQGTMNNFTFGNVTHQYYETLCGGAGAGEGFDGASAVQTHMTNSRLTDPEVLEMRYPVRVERFEVRHGSGGPGRWRGGDGVVREISFQAPMTAAILANRRRNAPFGLNGGGDAMPGLTEVVRVDGTTERLSYAQLTDLVPGDRIRISTPGGGGFGAAEELGP